MEFGVYGYIRDSLYSDGVSFVNFLKVCTKLEYDLKFKSCEIFTNESLEFFMSFFDSSILK